MTLCRSIATARRSEAIGSAAITTLATPLLVFVLLLTQAALLAWQAWRYSPTFDEPAHLAAGLSHWKTGRFDLYCVNPPLVRLIAALPALTVAPGSDGSEFAEGAYGRPEFAAGRALFKAGGKETFWWLTLARWACIPFSLLGGYCCYCWARDLYGPLSGIVALILWCFCPNLLGNGALITPDAAAAAMGVMAGFSFWRWLNCNEQRCLPSESSGPMSGSGSWRCALLAGVTLGLAELTKFTWIVLFGLWPLIWLGWVVWRPASAVMAPLREKRIGVITQASQLAIILLVALNIVNIGYGFERTFERLDSLQFISQKLGGPHAHTMPGNRWEGRWLGAWRVPVPANYVRGIDVQAYEFERGKWSYLRGRQKVGGWWYYYIYATVVKMPLGVTVLIALAVISSLAMAAGSRGSRIGGDNSPGGGRNGETGRLEHSRAGSMVVLAPALAVFLVVSSQTGFTRYVRYVIPAFPFLFVWASQMAGASIAWMVDLWRRAGRPSTGSRPWPDTSVISRQSLIRALCSAAVICSLLSNCISSLAVFPHSLSYFNEVVGGPLNGHSHLLDANLDWGQDLLELKRWQDSHPDATPFHLACYGSVIPNLAISHARVPVATLSGVPADDLEQLIGWHAASANELYHYNHSGKRPDEYAWLRKFKPAGRAGYSILIFRISPSEAGRLRDDWNQGQRSRLKARKRYSNAVP